MPSASESPTWTDPGGVHFRAVVRPHHEVALTASSTHGTELPLEMLRDLAAPNESVPLSAGTMVVEFPEIGTRVDAHVNAVLAWHPRPHTRLEVAGMPLQGIAERVVNARVLLDGTRADCLVSRFSGVWRRGDERTMRVTLVLRGTTNFGDGTRLRRITFGVVNFGHYVGSWLKDDGGGWAGRLVLEAQGWRVVLDQRRDFRAVAEQLEQEGGFAITHAASLERPDGSEFGITEADPILNAVFLLLSFVRGHSVSMVLLWGEHESGERAWWRWLVPSAETWSDPATWFDSQCPGELQSLLETMLSHWSDSGWRKALQLGVYWYLQALKTSSTVDASIVLAFTGLDLVGWFWLVELEGAWSASSFDEACAAERLRCLLARIGVSPEIPPDLAVLASHAQVRSQQEKRRIDGPAALATLRNAAVHPKRRARVFDAPDEVRWEASTLALWYLELGLLRLLGHRGTYMNRITRKTAHGPEYVPWAGSPDPPMAG